MAGMLHDMLHSPARGNPYTGQAPQRNDTHTRCVTQEIMNKNNARTTMRDPTSSKLNIKGPKAADAQRALDMKLWRIHLDKFPEVMLETARQNRLIDQDVRARDLQEFQFQMVQKIEGALRESLKNMGHDINKFRIGGHDRGTYERFYRVEPGRFMTKPQFLTGMRRAFGDDLVKSSKALSKLYDSFDPDHVDEMDWRSFLFLLTMFMQPHDSCFTHLRWAFAIYSSIGTLDFEDCPEKMTLGEIKDMIVTPTLLRFRKDIKGLVENSWLELSTTDKQAMAITSAHGDNAIDKISITYPMFEKLFKKTQLSYLMQVSRTFGLQDSRPWQYQIETEFYHKSLTDVMKKIRREIRNDNEADAFIASVRFRTIKFHFSCIVSYVARRVKVRKMVLLCSVRWRNENVASFFDKWRYAVLVDSIVKQMQRIVRGFNARRRGKLITRINKRILKVQAGVRQIRKRVVFIEYNKKRIWAAKVIQKIARGRQARRKVSSRIIAMHDVGVRMVGYQREAFYKERKLKASWKIQMAMRRFVLRCKIIRRVENRIRLEALAAKMDMEKERARIAKELYKKEIVEWYVKRKEEYDLTVMVEGATAEGRKKIMAYRTRAREMERLAREAAKEELLEKQEEQRIELWIKNWEETIIRRVRDKGTQCAQCLIMPETPEDVVLANMLSGKIKAHVKVVLRRADKQKIPMEIPEAQDLAKKEIIDQEMENERARAKQQMKDEALAGQKELEEKHSRDWQKVLAQKERRRGWGVVLVVGFFRRVVSRKKLRKKAFERYEKHFDVPSASYFYMDKRTQRAMWVKPKSLDAYDVKGDPGWVIMFDPNGDMYFYQPSTWKMQWDPPFGSAICADCEKEFACVRFTKDKRMLCENCCNAHVQKLIAAGEHAQEIYFKPFKGNVDGAASTVFSYIKETNWWKHLLETDPSMKLSQADLEAEERLKNKRKGILGEPCVRCQGEEGGDREATKICEQCLDHFCDQCYESKHSVSPWDNHSWVAYEKPKPKKRVDTSFKKRTVAEKEEKEKADKERREKRMAEQLKEKEKEERGRSKSPKSKGPKGKGGKSKSPGGKGGKGKSPGGKGGKSKSPGGEGGKSKSPGNKGSKASPDGKGKKTAGSGKSKSPSKDGKSAKSPNAQAGKGKSASPSGKSKPGDKAAAKNPPSSSMKPDSSDQKKAPAEKKDKQNSEKQAGDASDEKDAESEVAAPALDAADAKNAVSAPGEQKAE